MSEALFPQQVSADLCGAGHVKTNADRFGITHMPLCCSLFLSEGSVPKKYIKLIR
jgi:hypothetical protein